MAQGEREPGRGPQHDERQSRDRQLGNAAQQIWGAVAGQSASPAPSVEDVIAVIGSLNEARAYLPVRPLRSSRMHRHIPFDSAPGIEAPKELPFVG